MSSGNTSITSRLVQPTANPSRLSATYGSKIASPSSRSQTTSANRISGIQSSTGRRLDQFSRSPTINMYGSVPPSSSVNASGLPALRQRPQISTTSDSSLYSSNQRQQQVSSPNPTLAPAPSTIGSALRRRQPSPAATPRLIKQPTPSISRVPMVAAIDNSYNSRQRSQGHRTTSLAPNHRSTTTTFAIHLPANQPNKHQNNQRQQSLEADDADEDAVNAVESLPQLKSTNYISKMISGSRDSGNRDLVDDPRSEPVKQSQSQMSDKPSQLVRPLVKSSTTVGQVKSSGKVVGSRLPSPASSTASGPTYSHLKRVNRTSTFVPNSADKISTSRLTCGTPKQSSNTITSSQLPKPQADSTFFGFQKTRDVAPKQNSRRLSLQQPTAYSKSLSGCQVLNAVESQQSNASISSSFDKSDGDYEDSKADVDEDEDEDEEVSNGDEEDDDATTASTTMSQSYDLNLATANQELNNMIQMLSSSAILGTTVDDTNSCNEDSLHSASSTSYENEQKKKKPRASIGTKSKSQTSPVTQLPKIKDSNTKDGGKVLKSQSLSFQTSIGRLSGCVSKMGGGLVNEFTKQQTLADSSERSTPTNQIPPLNPSSSTSAVIACQKQQQQPRVKLQPRPRSRIIFDPISSQFHVSCTEGQEDENDVASSNDNGYKRINPETSTNDTLQSSSETNSSTDSNEELILDDASGQEDDEHEDVQDEASRKLLDTQNQIISLKYLPRSEELSDEVRDTNSDKHESETIKRLKDCRGSLESLAIIGGGGGDTLDHSHSHSCQEQPRRQRSPVGAALRSIFGIQQNPSGEVRKQPLARHGSLRNSTSSAKDIETSTPTISSSLIERKHSFKIDRQPSLTVANESSNNEGLLRRASKKLSASSSSLRSSFKFITSQTPPLESSSSAPVGGTTTNSDCGNLSIDYQQAHTNQGLPPKMPVYDQSKQGTSTGGSSSNSSLTNNGTEICDQQHQKDKSPMFGFKTTSDIDTTLTSDTSTLHGDDIEQSNLKKRCSELEHEVTNLDNKLSTKDKELRELQLKLWSSDYLIDQLKANITRLEKENAQLKAVVISSGGSRVYL